MITRTDSFKLTGNTLFPTAVRIAATHTAYSGISGYGIYCQDDNAVISCNGGNCVVHGKITDGQELAGFLKLMGNTVFCSRENADLLNVTVHKKANVMAKQLCYPELSKEEYPPFSFEELYNALNEGTDGNIELCKKTEFIADAALRWRRKVAYGVIIDGACAVCFNVTNDAAFIGGVAVKKALRGTGLGAKAVTELEKCLGNRLLTVCCLDNVVGFYEKLGFTKMGETVYGTVK